MNDEINYKNNPLHGVRLKKMLLELTDHYGFEILFAYLNINCFKNNPSVASSVKFLKKTDWAREKVEAFYLYSYKNLPKASHQQYQLSPRDRIIPDDQTVGEPAQLSLADAERLREERDLRATEYDANSRVSGKRTIQGEQSNLQSSAHIPAPEEKRESSKRRVASTADNPWGIPRS